MGDMEVHENICSNILEHVAYAAGWFMKKRPEEKTAPNKRKKEQEVRQYQHDITERRLGGWECTRCQRMALSRAGLKAISAAPCSQVTQAQVHPSHSIDRLHGITWCTRCGAYALRWPRRLKQPCAGTPCSEAQANVRRRLICGIIPTTASYLQDNADMMKMRSSSMDDVTRDTSGRGDGKTGGPASSSWAGGAYRWCYPRLPGGPLAAAPKVAAVTRDGDEENEDSAAVNRTNEGSRETTIGEMASDGGHETTVAPRRRIRTKSAPSVTCLTSSTPEVRRRDVEQVSEHLDAGPRRHCQPHGDEAWSTRLKCHFSARASSCGVCGQLTRTTCRGCERMICFACARTRKWCTGDRVTVST